MAWRFRKRIKVIPGVYLNLSKSGISTTIGPRGLSVNIGSKGTFLNTGIPGTGLYNRTPLSGSNTNTVDPSKANEIAEKLKYLLEQTSDGSEQIKSNSIEQLTSGGLLNLKQTIIAAHTEYTDISNTIQDRTNIKSTTDRKLTRLQKSIFKFLYKKRIDRLGLESQELQDELDELTEQQSLSTVDLKVNSDEAFSSLYSNVEKAYQVICSCNKIWDITTSKGIDRIKQRSYASTEIRRVEIKAMMESSGLIVTEKTPLKIQNKNGGDLYFYPAFVIVHEQALDFAILDYSEFNVDFAVMQFVETETVPGDTEIITNTWAKVNKDGTPDRRFNNNYQIPVTKYGEITFSSTTGLNEKYLVSNPNYSNLFCMAMKEYISAIKTANSMLNEFKG